MLHMLPNVEELRLFYYCLRPLDFNTLDVLRTIKAPVSLSLRSGKSIILKPCNQSPLIRSFSSAQDPSPLWDLLTIWPSVEHLEVVSWEMPSSHITKPPTGTWAPYEVRWLDESDSAEGTLPRLLRPGSLRILQLMKTPENAFFEEVLARHGPFLRSLRLKSVADEVAESLRSCTVLEEFKYIKVPSPAVLESLPNTIEHFSFQNSAATQSIGHVINWIEHHAVRLRVVTYNVCGSPIEPDFMHLADVCRSKGIELLCFADASPIREVRYRNP